MSKRSENRVDELFRYIKKFASTHGYPPSVREMGSALGVSSTATVQYYLEKLQKRGFIKKSSSKNRSIEVLDNSGIEKPKSITVPVVGKVAAGIPILATENIEEQILLPQSMFPGSEDMFVLNVSGESMINAGIMDGDKIVVSKQSTANNGEIVVALIDDSATVKRFYKENNQFRLQPENDFMSPIYLKEIEILGIVVGLIRKY